MDDLISRQAAIDALKRAEALTRAFGYHHVIETIRELPTADLSEYCDKLWKIAYERGKAEARVIKLTEADKESLRKAMENAELTLVAEPRKGKWIEHNPHKWGLGIVFECSECGEEVNCEECNYCPNCGAKMEV